MNEPDPAPKFSEDPLVLSTDLRAVYSEFSRKFCARIIIEAEIIDVDDSGG